MSGESAVGCSGSLAGLGFGKAAAFAVEDELGIVDEGHALGLRRIFCARTDEVDVGAFVEDEARGLDGVTDAFDAGDAAGAEGGAIHEEGVELDAAVAGEEAAAAGVEGGVVFQRSDGGFDGIECGAGALENAPTVLEGIEDALFVGFEEVGRDIPGAAVDEEDGRSVHRGKEGLYRFGQRGGEGQIFLQAGMMSLEGGPITGACQTDRV